MENEENKGLVSSEAVAVSAQSGVSSSQGTLGFVYSSGEEAKDVNGKDADSSAFKFVQQDKSIHDVKFTTKPTTFMKDAMKRFAKNRSSVVGGIILGVLFALSLILPVAMTGVDITMNHDYETHLPMKLFPAGTGFWDGTRVSKNEVYPYVTDSDGNDERDENGNLIFNNYDTYPDPDVVVKVSNRHATYMDHSASGAQGGYARITKDANPNGTGYMVFNSPVTLDFTNNKYTITYDMGTDDTGEYLNPEYSVVMMANGGAYFLNGGYSDNYGTALTKSEGASIVPHEYISFDLAEGIKSATDASGKKLSLDPTTFDKKNLQLGLAFKADATQKTALYTKSFRISGTKNDGSELRSVDRKALDARSFGTNETASTNDVSVADANAMVQIEQTVDGVSNVSYWTRESTDRFDAVDTFIVRADITYDMYLVTYGKRNNMTVSGSRLEAWKKKRLVDYTSLDDLVADPSTFTITDAGAQSNDMYITRMDSVKLDDSTGTNVYTATCQVMMYKYLGYSSIPLHLFGTERKGKDMLKYVFSGLRTSLILGIIVSAINILIGVVWGSISGYYGGAVDITMERITDILSGIPYIVLMTVLTIKMGTTFFVFALSLCLTGWIGTASTTRSQFYRYRGREYVLAAKTLGAKPSRLIFRHVLPNAIGTIVTSSVLMIPSTIFSEATISYLGLGLTTLDSLGVILSANQAFLSQYPGELIVPAVIISLLMICFNLFGNGLRDAFNPSLKGED